MRKSHYQKKHLARIGTGNYICLSCNQDDDNQHDDENDNDVNDDHNDDDDDNDDNQNDDVDHLSGST